MRKIISITIISFTMLFQSCIKEQDKVSWLKIDKWILNENPLAQNDQGEMSHNFNQAFISMNGKFLGAFELPAKIPILAEGSVDLIIVPGVVMNGINDTKTRYPFLENYSQTLTLILEDTVEIVPQTRYFANTQFLIEDFENPGMNIQTDGNSVASLVRDNDSDFLEWGNFFGKITLNDADSIFIGLTNFNTSLPKGGQNVFLELDVLNTNSLTTSVISLNNNLGTYDEDINIQINPQSNPHWRRLYINLTEIVSFRSNANQNEQGFIAYQDKAGEETFICLDNIKVVYR